MNYQKYTVTAFIPSGQSEATEWMQWHKQLKMRFGKKKANLMWMKAWRLRAGAGSSASTVELRNYMGKQGVNIDTTSLESIADTVDDIGDFFGGILSAGLWVGVAIGGVLLIAVGAAVYQLVRNPRKTVSTAASFTPAGRAAKMV
jgi:hypothetical protein